MKSGRSFWASALAVASVLSVSCSRGRDYPPPFLVPSAQLKPSGYRVRWMSYEFPSRVARSSRILARVTFQNVGSDVWNGSVLFVRSFVASGASLSSSRGFAPRLSLKRPVAPGQSVTLERFMIETPAEPGDYTLVFELVNENVAWFSNH